MGKVMSLNDIMSSLDDTHEKVAEEGEAQGGYKSDATDSDEKKKSKAEIIASLKKKPKDDDKDEDKDSKKEEKTASFSPSGELEKIASQVAESEEAHLIKEAQAYGAAVCDGFMQRLDQYEKVAQQLPEEPTYQDAQGNVYTESQVKQAEFDETQEKIAAYEEAGITVDDETIGYAEEFIKEAADQGYEMNGAEALEKVADTAFDNGFEKVAELAKEAAFEQGYEDGMAKIAADSFEHGYTDTLEKTAEAFQEAGAHHVVEAMEKAAFDQGYDDAMEKIASSAFEQGYGDMETYLANVQ